MYGVNSLPVSNGCLVLTRRFLLLGAAAPGPLLFGEYVEVPDAVHACFIGKEAHVRRSASSLLCKDKTNHATPPPIIVPVYRNGICSAPWPYYLGAFVVIRKSKSNTHMCITHRV